MNPVAEYMTMSIVEYGKDTAFHIIEKRRILSMVR